MAYLLAKTFVKKDSEVVLLVTGVRGSGKEVAIDGKLQNEVHKGHCRVLLQLIAGAQQCCCCLRRGRDFGCGRF